jgi:large subunit ribosomal protein L16
MLSPKKTKFRKAFKGKISGNTKSGATIAFGSFGLKALEPERITARQIEAARRTIARAMKRVGKLWIRIFPDLPITKKPADVRMGGGKGSPEYFAVRVHPGRILFELDGIEEAVARDAFEKAAAKLPIKTKFIKRLD